MWHSHKLGFDGIAKLVALVRDGVPNSKVAEMLGVTEPAVRFWRRFARADAEWIAYVRSLEHQAILTKRRISRLEAQLAVATNQLSIFVPSNRRRTRIAKQLKEASSLSRTAVNEVFGLSPSAGLTPVLHQDNDVLLARMRKVIENHPAYGFDRILRTEFAQDSIARNRLLLIYRDNRLAVEFRKPLKRQAVSGRKFGLPERPAEVWAMDFMLATAGRHPVSVLNIIDEFSRECLVCTATKLPTAKCVVDALTVLANAGRKPAVMRTDNGPQFVSRAYMKWLSQNGVAPKYSRPRTPKDNLMVERFNQTLRRELLDFTSFRSFNLLAQALERWRIEYNHLRPHQSLGGLTPVQFRLRYELFGD